MNQNVVTYTVVVSVDNEAFQLTKNDLDSLHKENIPSEVLVKLKDLKDKRFESRKEFLAELTTVLDKNELAHFQDPVLKYAGHKVGLLSPYLTTNLTFIVADKKDALLVPNSALRWQPAEEQIAPEVRDAYHKMRGKKRSPTDTEASSRGVVWVQGEDGHVRFIEVHTGLSDSINTEITGGDLPEGTQVITGEAVAVSRSAGANPFVASPFSKKKE
jgi:hypothetical protein